MKLAALMRKAEQDGLTIRADAGQVKLRGPSDVIRKWRPLLAQHKAELLATLAANDAGASLDHLIREAATYFEATPEDLEIMNRLAKADPNGLEIALKSDPLRPFYRMAKA